MGDAAFGMTGLDFETAVRDRIPMLTVVLNNFSMAFELKIGPAVRRAVAATEAGRPALLEFITSQEVSISMPGSTVP
jgi:acetolactate synthase-1/2/3 large subunit